MRNTLCLMPLTARNQVMYSHHCDYSDIDHHHTALSRLPQAWQRVFQDLGNSLEGLRKAEVWFADQYSSQYGARPVWTDLLQSLTASEPLLISDGTLCFQPRLFTFPSSAQRNFLVFVRQHLDIVPSEALWTFMTEVFNDEYECVDPWLKLLVQDLKNSLTNLLKPEKGVKGDTLSYMYSFSSEDNANLFKQLCSDIKSTQSKLPWQHNYGYPIKDLKDVEVMEITSLPKAVSPELISSDNSLTGDEGRTDQLSPQGREEADDNKTVSMNDDNTETEKHEGKDSIVTALPGGTTHPVRNRKDFDYLEAPAVKRLKLEDADLSFSATQGDVSLSQVSEPLTAEDWTLVAELKEVWHSATADTPAPDQIRLFVLSTPAQVVEMCGELQLDSLSDVAMTTACEHICSLGDQLSSSNCGHILSALVLPKVKSVSQTMSRSLISILTKLSKQFPRQLIEHVIVPCVQDDSAAPFHSEMICKVAKENFTDANRTFLLQRLLEDANHLSSGMVALLQVLIDLKVSMDKDTLSRCVDALREGSTLHAENLKFGKLLLAFVTKYGKQMDSSHVERLKNIEAENRTFLKKAISASLARL